MPHTRSKEVQVSPIKTPLKHYQRRHYHFTHPPNSPLSWPIPLEPASSSSQQAVTSSSTSQVVSPSSSSQVSNPPSAMANPQPNELATILSRVNIKFPTFKGLSTEDADNHVRRSQSSCKGQGLNREDAYLVFFPSTLDNLADKWFCQFAQNHFRNWDALKLAFGEAFRSSNFQERILNQLENLQLQSGETFAELMTKTKALVGKLLKAHGNFMVRK